MKVLLLALTITLTSLAEETDKTEKRFDVAVPASSDVASMSISPDGQNFVFVVAARGRQQLWIRDLKSESARPLPGTEDVSLPYPFWSPDGKSVGFFKGNEIHRIDIETGKQQTVVMTNVRNIGVGRGATWNKDHTILFATSAGSTILRLSDSGGPVSPVTQLERPRQSQHLLPSFLPDGRHFLYYVVGTDDASGVYLGDIDGTPGKKLVSADSSAVYATSGQILFAHKGRLIAQDFDLATLNVTGSPFQVAEKVSIDRQTAAISASSTGHVAYRSEGGERQFTWFDRSGKNLGAIGGSHTVTYTAMSRDGSRVAIGRTLNGNLDIWLLDTGSGAVTQITNNTANEINFAWSPNDRRLAFSSNRNGGYELYEKRAPFDGPESLLLTQQVPSALALDWSPDGRYLLVRQGAYNILVVQMDGLKVAPFVTTSAISTIITPQFSPDGKWLAFTSNRSGREEIHIAPFSPGTEFQPSGPVSVKGGAWPRWAQDGSELFYIAPDGLLLAVPFDITTGETKLPKPLFAPPMISSVASQYPQQYMVAPDGRFLVVAAEEILSPIRVITNLKHP